MIAAVSLEKGAIIYFWELATQFQRALDEAGVTCCDNSHRFEWSIYDAENHAQLKTTTAVSDLFGMLQKRLACRSDDAVSSAT